MGCYDRRLFPDEDRSAFLRRLGAGHKIRPVTAAIESRYGVDRPLNEQYFNYISSLLLGDWGWSFSTSMPVSDLIRTHWVYSFRLILLSSIFTVLLGITIGIYSASRKNTTADHITTFFSFACISIPNFWLRMMLIFIFSVKLGWFKTYYDTGPIHPYTVALLSSIFHTRCEKRLDRCKELSLK